MSRPAYPYGQDGGDFVDSLVGCERCFVFGRKAHGVVSCEAHAGVRLALGRTSGWMSSTGHRSVVPAFNNLYTQNRFVMCSHRESNYPVNPPRV